MTKRFTLGVLIYCGIVIMGPSLAMAGNTGGLAAAAVPQPTRVMILPVLQM